MSKGFWSDIRKHWQSLQVVTRKEFYEAHKRCPRCGSSSVGQTLAGKVEYPDRDFFDDINKFICGCGAKGYVFELLPGDNTTA